MEDKTMIGAPPSFASLHAQLMAQEASKQASQSNAQSENPSWKLKTNFGLIYDFPDTESLQNWITARETLDGYKLSIDGHTYKDIHEFQEIDLDAKPQKPPAAQEIRQQPNLPKSTPQPEDLGPKPVRSTKTAENIVHRPTRPVVNIPKSRKTSPLVILSITVVIALMTGLVLQVSGVINFRKAAADKKQQAADSRSTSKPEAKIKPPAKITTDNVEDEVIDDSILYDDEERNAADALDRRKVTINPMSHKGHIQNLLNKAESYKDDGEYDKAIRTLNSARGIAPNNTDIYRRLESIYQKTGNTKAYQETRARRESIEKL